jgi:hypothetical protein
MEDKIPKIEPLDMKIWEKISSSADDFFKWDCCFGVSEWLLFNANCLSYIIVRTSNIQCNDDIIFVLDQQM